MQDSSDQTTHQLQQEIKKLKKTLAQKDRELNQKDRELVKKDREITKKGKELGIERRLWKNRAADWDPGDSTDLHRIEVFDGIISDESSLYSATLKTKEKFQHILEHAGAYVGPPATRCGCFATTNPEPPIPETGASCVSGTPYSWHWFTKKTTPRRGVLQAVFGIDQTSVCRYIKVMNKILAEVLPTANNISQQG